MFIKALIAASLLFLSSQALAGDITRSHDFIDGEILTAALLDAAFDEIVVQANDLTGDNLASNIAITSSGAMAFSGATTLTGTFAANGTTNSIGNGGTDNLTLNVPGGMTLSAATTWTLTGALTFSGTIANLGIVTTADINGGTIDGATIGGSSAGAGTFTTLNATGGGALTGTWTDMGAVTTIDINGGTLDGVQVGGTTATGELLVNDASDDADGLGSQGTSGQFLQSAGAGANPAWTNVVGGNLVSGWIPYAVAAGDGACGGEGEKQYLIATTNYCFSNSGNGSPVPDIVSVAWLKTLEVRTITGKIYVDAHVTYAPTITLEVSGITASDTVTENTEGLTAELSIDVSGLTNGTWYTIDVNGDHANSGGNIVVSEIDYWVIYGE